MCGHDVPRLWWAKFRKGTTASVCASVCVLGIVQDIKANVDQLLAHMEVAAEKDMEANKQGKPAVMKLKMLPQVSVSLRIPFVASWRQVLVHLLYQGRLAIVGSVPGYPSVKNTTDGPPCCVQVEDKLAKRGWHDELLASGILGVLKAWIEPLPDGNLPNIKANFPQCLCALMQAFKDHNLVLSQYERGALSPTTRGIMGIWALMMQSLCCRRFAQQSCACCSSCRSMLRTG